jgi:hypothetical protein
VVTLFALVFTVVISIYSLARGYADAGLVQIARWIMYFGAFWLFAIWRRWRWFRYSGLIFNFLAALLGLWFLNFSPGWMFAGSIGALVAFDLTNFRESLRSDRLKFPARDAERAAFESHHLRHVTFVALLGLLLASIGMILTRHFDPGWGVLLILIAALGILQAVNWFRVRI